MLVLLPPSESKRSGGVEGSALDLPALSFPRLLAQRREALRALRALPRRVEDAAAILGLGPALHGEIDRNREVTRSPVLPAMDRYVGVLYDALDPGSLTLAARDWLADHAAVHSALFGLVGAADGIPAYRLSYDSRLPALDRSLKSLWATAVTAELERTDTLIVDLRSKGYQELGPAPNRLRVVTISVVTETAAGEVRALNHFNKKGKGEFVRSLAVAGVDHADESSLLEWADGVGVRLRPATSGVLELVV